MSLFMNFSLLSLHLFFAGQIVHLRRKEYTLKAAELSQTSGLQHAHHNFATISQVIGKKIPDVPLKITEIYCYIVTAGKDCEFNSSSS